MIGFVYYDDEKVYTIIECDNKVVSVAVQPKATFSGKDFMSKNNLEAAMSTGIIACRLEHFDYIRTIDDLNNF